MQGVLEVILLLAIFILTMFYYYLVLQKISPQEEGTLSYLLLFLQLFKK